MGNVSELLQPQLAALHIHRHAIATEELVADDAADLEAKKDARRAQVEHDEREVAVLDSIEIEVDAGHQERVAVPARGAVDPQRDATERRLLQRLRGLRADR